MAAQVADEMAAQAVTELADGLADQSLDSEDMSRRRSSRLKTLTARKELERSVCHQNGDHHNDVVDETSADSTLPANTSLTTKQKKKKSKKDKNKDKDLDPTKKSRNKKKLWTTAGDDKHHDSYDHQNDHNSGHHHHNHHHLSDPLNAQPVQPSSHHNHNQPSTGQTGGIRWSTDSDNSCPLPQKLKSRWRRYCELESGHQPDKHSGQTLVADVIPEDTEPYHPFDPIDQNIYLFERKKSKTKKETRRMVCDCILTKEERMRGLIGCGDDCLNRMLMIECGSRCALGDHCANKRFQKRQCAKVEPFRTSKKGWGLRAMESLQPNTFIMEYVGEVIDPLDFHNRTQKYSKEKREHHFFMALKSDEIIDATVKGNITRFVNHSCDPNSETQKWTVNGELRIGFFTQRFVQAGEEITFDYQFQRYGKEAQKCFCESMNCRGYIGATENANILTDGSKITAKVREELDESGDDEDKLEDLALEEEIAKLSEGGGLRNRQQVLMMARLMVRAEDTPSRLKLIHIIKGTVEMAYLRLLLDYHGLQLMWSWMVEVEDWELKAAILELLEILPIPNKTMLTDSKVYSVVERWALQTDEPELSNQSLDLVKVSILESQVAEPVADVSVESIADSVESVVQSIVEPIVDSVTEQIADSITEPIADSVPEPTGHSVNEPIADSVTKPIADSVTESIADSITETIAESMAVSVTEPIVDSITEPTTDSIDESIANSIVEPIVDSVVKAITDSDEAVVEPIDEPIVSEDTKQNSPKVESEVLAAVYSSENTADSVVTSIKSETELTEQPVESMDTIENTEVLITKEEESADQLENMAKSEAESTKVEIISDENKQLLANSVGVKSSPRIELKSHSLSLVIKSRSLSTSAKSETTPQLTPTPPVVKCRPTIASMAQRLLYNWKELKEVFRIPRLERQKRHEDEKEADRKTEEVEERRARGDYDNKRGVDDRDYTIAGILGTKRKGIKRTNDTKLMTPNKKPTGQLSQQIISANHTLNKVSKEEHRKMFEMEVAQKDYQEALKRYYQQLAYYNATYGQQYQMHQQQQQLQQQMQQLYPQESGGAVGFPTTDQFSKPPAYPYGGPFGYNTASNDYYQPTVDYTAVPAQTLGYNNVTDDTVDSQMTEHIDETGVHYDKSTVFSIKTAPALIPLANFDNLMMIERQSSLAIDSAPHNYVVYGDDCHQKTDDKSSDTIFDTLYPPPGVFYVTSVDEKYYTPLPIDRNHKSVQILFDKNITIPLAHNWTKSSTTDCLPPNWRYSRDKNGDIYYYHKMKRKPQWHPPSAEVEAVPVTKIVTQAVATTVITAVPSDADITMNDVMNNFKTKLIDDNDDDSKSVPEVTPVVETPKSDTLAVDTIDTLGLPPILVASLSAPDIVDIQPAEAENSTHSPPNLLQSILALEADPRRRRQLLNTSAAPSTTTAAADTSSSSVTRKKSFHSTRQIQEYFRNKMSEYVVHCLNPYRKPDCKKGRIVNNSDFKYLARKLTHTIMGKEIKQCKSLDQLSCNESVKTKTKEYVKKYMARFGPFYKSETSGAADKTSGSVLNTEDVSNATTD